jgi:hypothetical protein
MGGRPKARTKAELLEMLAEAVRNTQPPALRGATRTEAQNSFPQSATGVEARGHNQKRPSIGWPQAAASIKQAVTHDR